jgi:2-dehydropantoate 2-reductase
MLQDVKHHRPTEIDYLNGAIVRLGAKHQRKLPVNQLWTGRIREKEKFML